MAELYDKELFVSWQELHNATIKLARQLLPAERWKGIIAVTRGGLAPAAIVAGELNVRFVDTVCVSRYDHNRPREAKTLKPPDKTAGDGKGFLVVDDIADTGDTLKTVKKMLPEAVIAVVYAKPQGAGLADYHSEEVEQKTWVCFPWDSYPSHRDPLAGAE